MNILILGGISEALWLAEKLASTPHKVTYSLAGKGEVAELPCEVRVGGFEGVEGLTHYLKANHVDLLIDATHPYAENISLNAWQAADKANVELWSYQRPAWEQTPEDHWVQTPHWFDALTTSDFQRPFITVGSSVAADLSDIPDNQHWFVRALPDKLLEGDNYTLVPGRGPFALEDELAIIDEHKIDVIVSKNSGGESVSAKVQAARLKELPIIMLSRPQLIEPERLFLNIEFILEALS